MNEKELLGAKIRFIRKNKNMSQEVLAEKADLSPRQIIKIENGQSAPTVFSLQRIASALDTSIESILDNKSFDSIEVIKSQILKKINNLTDINLRFIFRILSSLD